MGWRVVQMSDAQIPPGSSPDRNPPIEDILASIRRVLSKIKGPADIGNEPPEGQRHRNAADRGVLVLDPSMMASDSRPENRAANELAAAPAMDAERAQRLWLWEQAAVRDQLARLEHKIDVLGFIATAGAAIGASTGLGVVAGFFLGVEVGAAVYGLSCVVTVILLRFAFNRRPSGPR
jgi:hypothetical protein